MIICCWIYKMVFLSCIVKCSYGWMISHKICMIYAFFEFFVQKIFCPNIIFCHKLFTDLKMLTKFFYPNSFSGKILLPKYVFNKNVFCPLSIHTLTKLLPWIYLCGIYFILEKCLIFHSNCPCRRSLISFFAETLHEVWGQ